jgi:hypothetical protein
MSRNNESETAWMGVLVAAGFNKEIAGGHFVSKIIEVLLFRFSRKKAGSTFTVHKPFRSLPFLQILISSFTLRTKI